jgi:hypothetical protein
MRDDDACGICYALADLHCRLHGAEFCRIKEEYLTTDMTGDELIERLVAACTPEQAEEVQRALASYDPPAAEAVRREAEALRARPNPALEEAARRWAEHWAHGKP